MQASNDYTFDSVNGGRPSLVNVEQPRGFAFMSVRQENFTTTVLTATARRRDAINNNATEQSNKLEPNNEEREELLTWHSLSHSYKELVLGSLPSLFLEGYCISLGISFEKTSNGAYSSRNRRKDAEIYDEKVINKFKHTTTLHKKNTSFTQLKEVYAKGLFYLSSKKFPKLSTIIEAGHSECR